MDNHVNKNIKDTRVELAELQAPLKKAVQQHDDAEAEIAANYFRELIRRHYAKLIG